jgi:hypothetical protein
MHLSGSFFFYFNVIKTAVFIISKSKIKCYFIIVAIFSLLLLLLKNLLLQLRIK